MPPRKDRFEMLPMESIGDNPFQIGYPLDEQEVVKAAYQIRDRGMTFPLIVRPWGASYQVAAGQRWLAACRLVGARTVPSLIHPLSDEDMASLAFEEASLRGIITPGHGKVLIGTVGNAWISNLLDRLREGAEGYRVDVDPEAARNLPVPQIFLQQAAGPSPAAAPAAPGEQILLVHSDAPAPPPLERGLYDTLLGFRCRHVPQGWFQTVSDVGKRWVLESASSGGRLEISVPFPTTASADAAAEAFGQQLLARHPGTRLEKAGAREKGGLHCVETDLSDADLRHRFVLLWKGGRSVVLHLWNTPRFFLYDMKALSETVEATVLI